MDFESPDVAKEFPGLYASGSMKRSQSHGSDYSDGEKISRKDKEKKKDKKESKKDKGYMAFEGESTGDEESKSPGKSKKNKLSNFKFRGDKKEKKHKEREVKEKVDEKEKASKKDSKECKETKSGTKKKKSKLIIIKEKKKKNVPVEVKEDRPIFGVPLALAVDRSKIYDDIPLPVVVRECIDYIEDHGLSCEGIYRISGLKSKVRQLKGQYDRGEKVYLYESDPHVVASLLKVYLHDLPSPILPTELMPKFEAASVVINNPQIRVNMLQELINKLPRCNRVLLSWIIVHMLHVLALEKRNKMNIQNITIIFSPTLKITHYILHAFFAHGEDLFRGVELKKYLPPTEVDTSRMTLDLPESPSAIAAELSKQENVLNILHGELNAGLQDKKKEEELWEIQRVVTQLKRKLRFLKHIKNSTSSQAEALKTSTANFDSTTEFQINTGIQKIEQSSPPSKHSNAFPKDALKSSSQITNASNFPCSTSITCDSSNQESNAEISLEPNISAESIQILDPDDSTSVQLTQIENISKCESTSASIEEQYSLPKSSSPVSVEIPSLENNPTDDSILENHDINVTKEEVSLEKDSDSSIMKNDNEISSLVEKMLKNSDNESFLSEIHKCIDSLTSSDSDNFKEEIHFAAQLYLNILGDELILVRNDLKRKKNSEVFEIERLKLEINESLHLLKYKQYSFDSAPLFLSSSSTENSSSDSDHSSVSDNDEEDKDLQSVLTDLLQENKRLMVKSGDYLKLIEKERERYVNVKVLMKMLQIVRRLRSLTY